MVFPSALSRECTGESHTSSKDIPSAHSQKIYHFYYQKPVNSGYRHSQDSAMSWWHTIKRNAKDLIHELAQSSSFWDMRATQYLSDDLKSSSGSATGSETSDLSTLQLRKTVLIRAPALMSTNELNDLFPLYGSLSLSERADCVIHWI